MPSKKYDWEKLKQEFFESSYMEVKAFFLNKGVPYNEYSRKFAKGWRNEKKEHKKNILTKTQEGEIQVKIDYAKRREQKVQEAIDWIIDDIIKRVKNTDNRKERVTYLEKLKEDIGEGKKMILDVNNTSHERTEEDKEILQSIADRLWLDWKMLV